jgi:Tfp pilus assembly protein PilV
MVHRLALALRSQHGMTIVELMVSTVVLAVGVLGTVSMIDSSNATTSRNKAREGATNLGRAVMEVARGVPYKDLDPETVLETVNSRPGMEDASGAPGHQISSRNFTYTLAVTICTFDDAKDGLGEHDDADPGFCPESEVLPTGQVARDKNPDDYRRIEVKLDWNAAAVGSTLRQTGVITNPVGGLGPSITELRITAPTLDVTTIDFEAPTASFKATTSVSAVEVNWYVDGERKGKASGGPLNWTFDWDLAETRADGSLVYPDCTYVVSADALDDKNRTGSPKALTVKLNRVAPVEPANFEGGRNLNGSRVDLQWGKNRECDITGYRVYRGTSPGAIDSLVCSTPADETECLDESAPAPQAGQTLYYQAVATDLAPNNTTREGDRSDAIAVSEGNNAPTAPTGLVACAGGSPGCVDSEGEPAAPGTIAITWTESTDPDLEPIYFYRVYRNGDTYADRYDVLFPVAGKPLTFVDARPDSGSNTYRVSAVDARFGESTLSAPVTLSP